MIRSAICLVLFPLLLMAPTGAETNDPAIRAGMDRLMDAWNHHDTKVFAGIFSEEGGQEAGETAGGETGHDGR